MPVPDPLYVLVVYVPERDTATLLAALFQAGAGAVGRYRECAFVAPGTGQFRPLAGADPHLGRVGELEYVAENRVEVVVPASVVPAVVEALRRAHPYEEPAFHVLATLDLPSPGPRSP